MSPIKHRVQVFPAFRQSGELRIRKKTNNTQTIKGTGGGRLIPCSISVWGGGDADAGTRGFEGCLL
jgi:hypothetical protein